MSIRQPNVMIVGAIGGVAMALIRLLCQYRVRDICLASRTQSKCEAI